MLHTLCNSVSLLVLFLQLMLHSSKPALLYCCLICVLHALTQALPYRFIERNELPTSYREQIVEFILQKTAGAVSCAPATHNVDPFTGGGAYVPGSSNFPQPGGQASSRSSADPFTGTGGYVPGVPMDVDNGQCRQLYHLLLRCTHAELHI